MRTRPSTSVGLKTLMIYMPHLPIQLGHSLGDPKTKFKLFLTRKGAFWWREFFYLSLLKYVKLNQFLSFITYDMLIMNNVWLNNSFPLSVVFRICGSKRMENLCLHKRDKLWSISISRPIILQPMEMAGKWLFICCYLFLKKHNSLYRD